MKTKQLFLLVVSLMVLVIPAYSQDDALNFGDITKPISVVADMLTYDRENNIYTAEGNVEITRDTAILRADRIVFHGDTGEAEAAGGVHFTDGLDTLDAEKVALNIDTKTGIIYNGMVFYADKHFYITGKEMEKLGENTYRVYKGSLTSCDGEVPEWKITARRSKVTIEGHATVSSGGFFIKNFPVFYIPYGVFPVRTKRQSGLLFPAVGFSDREGFKFMGAFFWAINKSMDATFFADLRTERGVKIGGEYRYFLSKDVRGQINYNYIDDQKLHDNRWSLSFDHSQRLPGDIYTLWDINMVSDDDYIDNLANVADNLPTDADRYLESRVSFWKEFDYVGLFLDASYFDDFKSTYDEETLQRLPRLTVYTQPVAPIGGFPAYLDLASSFANYRRDDGIEGMRLIATPRLTVPLHLGPLNVTNWVAGSFTEWWLDGDDLYPNEMDRFVTSAGTELFTYLSRTYYPDSGYFSSVKHIIKPVLRYTYTSHENEGDYPYFDADDRTRSQSLLTAILVMRLLGEVRDATDATAPRDILYFEAGVDVDFDPDPDWFNYDVSDTHVRSFYKLRLSPSQYFSTYFEAAYDHDRNEWEEMSANMLFTDGRGDSLSLGYVYQNDIVTSGEEYEQIWGALKLVVYDDLDFFCGARYSIEDNDLRYINAGIDYHRQCWGVYLNFYSKDIPEDFGVMANITLTGLGSLQF